MGAVRTAPHLGKEIVTVMRSVMVDLFSDYRPERHYMRGPGPKWREKHQPQRAAQPVAAASALGFRFARVTT